MHGHGEAVGKSAKALPSRAEINEKIQGSPPGSSELKQRNKSTTINAATATTITAAKQL